MSQSSANGYKSQLPADIADPLIGRILDSRYRIQAVLGSGGIGVVYRAEQLAIGRPVAIKVLHQELGAIGDLKRRFEREAKALSALSHPNIVTITDFGIAPGGIPYLCMELLEGGTLEQLLATIGVPGSARTLDIIRQMLRGLAFAHARSVVHRDLKPGNVFLQALPDVLDHVKLLDFGLAKFLDDDGAQSTTTTLTKAGTIFGTPAYMAPEQATGGPADARADVYSAGVMLYEMLAGRRPFTASTRPELIKEHLLAPVPPLSQARPGLYVEPQLETVIHTALAKEPGERYQDGQAMLTALESFTHGAVMYDASGAASVEARVAAAAPIPAPAPSGEGSRPGPLPAGVLKRPRPRLRRRSPRLATRRRSPLGLGYWVSRFALGFLIALGIAVLTNWRPWKRELKHMASTTRDHVSKVAQSATDLPHRVSDIAKRAAIASEARRRAEATATGPDAAVHAIGPRPPARDPWARGTPSSLSGPRRKVLHHKRLSRRDLRNVYRYAADHPRDPRPHLLLAHSYVQRDWMGDAVDRYRRAVEVDASARGDPRMLADLINMVGSDGVSVRAMEAIRDIFGPEAVPALDRAIARTTSDNRMRAKFVQLRADAASVPLD